MEQNARDVAAAKRKQIDAVLLQRLRLKPDKLRTLARGIRAIANAEEPLQKVLNSLQHVWLTGNQGWSLCCACMDLAPDRPVILNLCSCHSFPCLCGY